MTLQRTRRKSLLGNSKVQSVFGKTLKRLKVKKSVTVISAETWREYFESLFTDSNADHVYENIFESVEVTRDNGVLDSEITDDDILNSL